MNRQELRSDELYHYGVLGMKWGQHKAKKYEEKGGSYTKAGLSRYENSKAQFEEQKKVLKEFKKTGTATMQVRDQKTGKIKTAVLNPSTKQDKKDITKYLKKSVKGSKQYMKADYKHLSQDYKADKGKERYARGERIRANNAINNTLAKASGLAITASIVANKNGLIDDKTTKAVISAGVVAGGAVAIKSIIDEVPNNELRAYYSHTSNYR